MAKTRKNPARFDHANKVIILYKWFDEKARNPKSKEFKMLVEYSKSFPTYEIVVRDDINTNSNQEHYKGLSYDYMREYIRRYEPIETRDSVLKELEDRIFISECHSKGHRYPAIKNWFLKKYPEIANNGMPTNEDDSAKIQENKVEEIEFDDAA